MLPSHDQELLAVALNIERQHGTEGPKHIAEKIGGAALADDMVQVDFWKSVAQQYEGLLIANKRYPH